VLLDPQPLAEHLAQGVPDGVVLVARNGLDFGPGGAQARLQRIRGVEQRADSPLAAAGAVTNEESEGRRDHRSEDEQQGGGHAEIQERSGAVCRRFPCRIKQFGGRGGLTRIGPAPTIPRLMSPDSSATRQHGLPEQLDAWRMVAARRVFDGVLPLSAMRRLRDSLVDAEGNVHVEIEFDTDNLRVPYMELRIEAQLPLECQRSLQRFLHPVRIVQRLGLIRDEADEEALPEGYEALLVGDDGLLRPAELVEDELILAVPVVPVAPGTETVEQDWTAPEEEIQAASPFAALSALKQDKPQGEQK
jgi:uncharacterized protein